MNQTLFQGLLKMTIWIITEVIQSYGPVTLPLGVERTSVRMWESTNYMWNKFFSTPFEKRINDISYYNCIYYRLTMGEVALLCQVISTRHLTRDEEKEKSPFSMTIHSISLSLADLKRFSLFCLFESCCCRNRWLSRNKLSARDGRGRLE